MPKYKPPASKITFKQLYPGKPEAWYEEAEEIIDRYLELVLRIYEREAPKAHLEI